MVLRALDDIQSMFAHIHPFLLSSVKASEHISEQHRQYRASQYLKWEDESEGTAFPFYSK